MNNKKQYTSHLCTFMGREANLEVLLPYIEGALLNNAVDNYWFIDMTRKRSDHELIKRESARLNDMFPGRVHLHNSEERSKIIDDEDKKQAALDKIIKKYGSMSKMFIRGSNENRAIIKIQEKE